MSDRMADALAWSRRYAVNKARLDSGDLVLVARVVRELSAIGAVGALSPGEARILARARRMLGWAARIARDRLMPGPGAGSRRRARRKAPFR